MDQQEALDCIRRGLTWMGFHVKVEHNLLEAYFEPGAPDIGFVSPALSLCYEELTDSSSILISTPTMQLSQKRKMER